MLSLLADGSSASSALAGRLAVSPPSVTAVVDGLVTRGLVERQADADDRRRLTLLLTPVAYEQLIGLEESLGGARGKAWLGRVSAATWGRLRPMATEEK